MTLARISADGLPEAQLAHQIGMAAQEAASIKVSLLRRRLIRRDPPGRARVKSRLVLTERGQRADQWLERLQSSLPQTLFGAAEPPEEEITSVDPCPTVTTDASPSWPQRWLQFRRGGRSEMAELLSLEPATDGNTTFERGLFNVWLGTGLFVVAVAVGILGQSEIASLVALAMGVLVAVVFLSRATIVVFRGNRAVARLRRSMRALEPARQAGQGNRPPTHSGRA
jgi:Flp pilus assembly protein TadB